MNIKNFVKKIVLKEKFDSDSYINYLKKRGVRIGNDTTIYRPSNTYIDVTRPYLIQIGNKVKITEGVRILTHGYDWSVLNELYGDVLGSAGKVTIGDNVFVGMNTTILKGVTIGENCIIGANSLVNKDIPPNSVAAGNPVRVICSIDEYYKKRLGLQLYEAKTCAIEYKKAYGKKPTKDVFFEFFWLFEPLDDNEKFQTAKFNEIMSLNSNFDKSMKKYKNTERKFDSFEDFLDWCYNDDL